MDVGYALLIPIGPGEGELDRTWDLIESIMAYAPNVKLLVVVDCASKSRSLDSVFSRYISSTVVSFHSPYTGIGDALLGRQCAEILSVLPIFYRYFPVDFVLKIDTDALAIGPFSERIAERLRGDATIGIIGTVGRTCNRDAPDYRFEACVRPRWIRVLQFIPNEVFERARMGSVAIKIRNIGVFDPKAIGTLEGIRPDVQAALDHGYSSLEYCQGGAYVMSPKFIERMISSTYLCDPSRWLHIPTAEDVLIGMYARAVGLKIVDFSDRGEPFGIKFSGLAYPPSELLARGHALIHSVKNDSHVTEPVIRKYFRARRHFADKWPSSTEKFD